MSLKGIAALGLSLSIVSAANATVVITEWMYSGGDAEWVEFTNVGAVPVDMTGWSYDDDSRVAGTVDLSAFGTVQPGESVILAENDEATFRAAWSLAPTVKVIGSNTTNLSRNDEINLYNGLALVDRLTYGDQNFAGSIRTQNASGNPTSLAALNVNDPYQWALSVSGDIYGSYTSTGADIGNPGIFVPEPATLGLLVLGCAAMFRRRRTA